MTGTATTGGFGIHLASAAAQIQSSGNAAITLISDSMALNTSTSFVNAGTGPVTLRQSTGGVAINLGGTTDPFAGPLSFDDAEIDKVTAGTLNIGNFATGGISFSGAVPIDVTDGPVIPVLNLTTVGTGIASNPAVGVLDVVAQGLTLTSQTTTSIDMDATTLVSGSNGEQTLSEANTVTLGNGGISATVASPVTLVSGRFNTVAATGGILASTVQVQSGATIGGTGNSNTGSGNTIQSGAFVSPGTSPGILTLNTLTFNAGSTLDIEIGGTTPGNLSTDHDQLNIFSTVNLGGAALTLTQFNGFVPTAGQQFVIVNNDNADAITGTFAGLAEGAVIVPFLVPGMQATISYVGGTGNDVVLTAAAIPSGTLQFSSANYTVSEAGASATITVTRTGGTSGTVGATYQTVAGGTATGGAACGGAVDYINTSGTVSFGNGVSTSQTFSITICPDAALEPD